MLSNAGTSGSLIDFAATSKLFSSPSQNITLSILYQGSYLVSSGSQKPGNGISRGCHAACNRPDLNQTSSFLYAGIPALKR